MLKTAYRSITVTTAALAVSVAGAVMILPSTTDQVVASAPIHSGKGDRLDIRPLGAKCSEQGWPYFEATCLRDRRMALGKPKPVRLVAPDRLSLVH